MTMDESSGPSTARECEGKNENTKTENTTPDTSLCSQRVFKKTSPNNKLTLYLSSRDLVVSAGRIDRLSGVLLVDPEFVVNKKVYGQVTLTFRYGREDEEVMGLKFCNEAIMCLAQLYPPHSTSEGSDGTTTPLQDALLKRLGPNAYPFHMEITPLAPPSVQLVPAKEYNGAPIGTSYDVRAYVADKVDEKTNRRTVVRMGIRVVQKAFAPPSPHQYVPGIGKTSKERGKQNKKSLLFGCNSAPLDAKFPKGDQNISRSVETVRSSPRLETETHENTTSTRSEYKQKEFLTLPRSSESSKDNRVSFQGRPNNGSKSSKETEEHNVKTEEEESQLSDFCRSLCGAKRPSLAAYLAQVPAPTAFVDKQFLLSDGKIVLKASLDKAIYSHGEEIRVTVQVNNDSNKTVRRLKVFVVQHVDVCMFSNGKFKNVVAMIDDKEDCPITTGHKLHKTFTLLPLKSSTKNWIALEDSYTKSGSSLASTVTCNAISPDERNVFAIYVSYYVKVKLLVNVMVGDVSLKLPFTLMHTCSDFEHTETLLRVSRPEVRLELKSPIAPDPIEPEKDGT